MFGGKIQFLPKHGTDLIYQKNFNKKMIISHFSMSSAILKSYFICEMNDLSSVSAIFYIIKYRVLLVTPFRNTPIICHQTAINQLISIKSQNFILWLKIFKKKQKIRKNSELSTLMNSWPGRSTTIGKLKSTADLPIERLKL